jgi:hypothetical protein
MNIGDQHHEAQSWGYGPGLRQVIDGNYFDSLQRNVITNIGITQC